MSPLPKPFSMAAFDIEVAINEGRTEEALHKLVHALRSGADAASRLIAADWIEAVGLPPGGAKALRNGRPEMLKEWLPISEMVTNLQSDGATYQRAVEEAAAHFGYTERHVQKCVARWRDSETSAREQD